MVVPRRFPLVALAAALAVACSDTTAPPPTSVLISPRVASLALGDSVQLHAAALGSGGDTLRGLDVVWSSSNTTVLSLSSAGLAKAMAPGRATVSAVVAGAHDTLSLAVTVRFVQVVGTSNTLCGIASNGAAFCRGANDHGQLGDGTTTSSDSFVAVTGGHRFLSLAAGQISTCGLAADSTAWCWGRGAYGALGTGDTLTRTTPTAVAGGLHFTALALVDLAACAVTPSGNTYCWGYGGYGQTGDSALADRLTPTLLAGAPAFVSLAAGSESNCGLTASQAAWCWGDNRGGQLGVATDTVFHEPVATLGGQSFLTLAMRDQYCGLATDGSVQCWNPGGYGAYLQGPSDGRQYLDLSVAWVHACGVASDSTVYCWGYGSGSRAVTNSIAFASVAAGDYADCAVSSGGVAYCWFPHCDAAEDVVCTDPPVPFPVPAARPVTAISAGPDKNACVLEDDGTAACFYLDFVEYPVRADSSTTPVPVPGGLTFRSVVVGSSSLSPLVYGDYACGLAADGAAYCWATHDNGRGQVPRATVSTPVAVPGGLQYTSLDTYGHHVCGVAVDGTAYCWKPGDAAPTQVPGGRSFARVFSSWRADCALDAAGKAFCWGWNTNGELGLGFRSSQALTPIAVGGGRTFEALATGTYHACGLATGGAAWCWGLNRYGQLGTGDTTSSVTPVAVTGGLSFTALASFNDRTCGLAADGSAYCWGYPVGSSPTLQQSGTHFISLAPVSPSGLCGVTTAGEIVCWGATAAAPRRAPPLPASSGRRPSAAARRR
jgi:alpha-tubulin suppressor-like RCC1 family protein